MNDVDLLQQYAQKGSEEAFATLVNRHLNLVYATALRQVRSPQLAEEVAQSVFTSLARNANAMKPDTILTMLQKTLITATVAAAVGAGIYEAHQVATLQNQVQTLQQQQTEHLQQLQRERRDAANRLSALADEIERVKGNSTELLKLRGEVTRLRNNENDPAESEVKASLAKVNLLKQRLEQTPGAKIPEFQFLTEEDWLNAAKGSLNTDEDYRRAFSALRNAAEQMFRPMIQLALRRYIQGNNGQFPTDLSQLQSYFNTPVDDAILQRWEIVPASDFPNVGVGSDWVMTQKAAVDDEQDLCFILGPDGGGSFNFKTEECFRALAPALQAYSAANDGKELPLVNQSGLSDLSPLKPYIKTPQEQAAVQELMQIQKDYSAAK